VVKSVHFWTRKHIESEIFCISTMSSTSGAQGAVSTQWSLDTTAHAAIAMTTGILRAATSDNVQPLALSAVEAFGTTIAMSEVTRLKVQQAGKTHHSSYSAKFLKSNIGYAKGDCGDQLSASDSGTRFLGLAAALLCTSDTFFASRALHAMLEETAPAWVKQQRLMPTIDQLLDLFRALEHKLINTGFSHKISGYQTQFMSLSEHDLDFNLRCSDGAHPSLAILQALVEAFRSVDRLGYGDGIEVRISSGISWVAAFTAWCFEIPPTVRNAQGDIIVDQPSSKVTIWLTSKSDATEEVKITHGIERPRVLWTSPIDAQVTREVWSGMLSVKAYGAQQIHARVGSSTKARRAIFQALTHAVGRTHKRIFAMPASIENKDVQPYHPATTDEECASYRCSLFRTESYVNDVYREFTGTEVHSEGVNFHSQEFIADLAMVASYEKILATECACESCYTRNGTSTENALTMKELVELTKNASPGCLTKRFRDTVSILTAEILALSLFDLIEPVRVFWPGSAIASTRVSSQPFKACVDEVLWGDSIDTPMAFCSPGAIIRFATQLIGHDADNDIQDGTWVASYGRGQVVYPIIFDLETLWNEGALSFGGGPGCLYYNGSRYEKVVSHTPARALGTQRKCAEDENVQAPQNLFPFDKLEWQIEVAEKHLKLGFGPSSTAKIENPFRILTTMARSLFVSCGHRMSTPLHTPDRHASFSLTYVRDEILDPRAFDTVQSAEATARKHQDTNLTVIPVAGNEGLRLFSMTSSMPGVVRYNACLECCIKVARKSGLLYVVI
jgi:hypothetical protein